MTVKNTILGLYILIACLVSVYSENFRINRLESVVVSAEIPSLIVNMGYNDALEIVIPDTPLFLQGVELEIKIPQPILSFRNSVGYAVYEQVSPEPEPEIIDYAAERLHLEPLPSKLNFVLQIPFVSEHKLKSSPYATVLPAVFQQDKRPFLFRLLPVMKGLPENIADLIFVVEIKPILTNEGMALLSLSYPDERREALVIRIDETPVEDISEPFMLTEGMHHLSIVSEHYRNEVRVFNVDQARITHLEVALSDIAPTIIVVGPDNATAVLNDDREVAFREAITVAPGENSIRFIVGDYEIKRTIDVQQGKSYTVSLTIDVQIMETP